MDISTLNTQQQKAIMTKCGPLIIKAGPGTGKTRTLTARIEYLIYSQNISASNILALTFTRKAATEMRKRLVHLTALPAITTFHAFAFDILKQTGHTFEIISERDRNEIIQAIIEKSKGKEISKKNTKELSLQISNYKNTYNNQTYSDELVSQYDDQLKLRNLVDYDDLILILYKELQKKNEKIVECLKNITHVFIDEFQDTNKLQYEVIKLFCIPENLFVIGDPYQSIYGFRGADAAIFDEIKKDFSATIEITLEENYRSTKEIIHASSALFTEIIPLQAHNQSHGTINVVTTCDEYTEANYVLGIINKKVGGIDLLKTDNVDITTIRFSDIAVIYRNHHIGRKLQQIFLESGIPFQVIGEESPYAKPSIALVSNILAYSQIKESEILKAILYSTFLKIPSKILRTIRFIQYDKKVEYNKAVEIALGQEFLGAKDMTTLSTMINKFKKIFVVIKNEPISKAIHIICEQYAIEKSIDLQQYVSCAVQFEEKGIAAFIAYLHYLEEYEFYDSRAEKVSLMTMHSSKGLEFDTVCICGFEEGTIPPVRAIKENLDEEKRLLYVAMTRAKRNLYLIYPQKRLKESHAISIFYSNLSTLTIVENVKDESIEKREKKQEKWKEKKSQMALF
ncbi:DNA helicase PcrA [soil metagenome]